MSLLRPRLSKPKAVVVIIFCFVFAYFSVLIGVANLLHPDVPAAYLAAHPWRNTIACVVAITIGVALAIVAVATIRGSILRG